MSKSSNFFGQRYIGPADKNHSIVKKLLNSAANMAREVCKEFDGYTHLLTMLYA